MIGRGPAGAGASVFTRLGALALVTSLVATACFNPESGNIFADGPGSVVDPYRPAVLTAKEINDDTGLTLTSVDSVGLSELETCGRRPLETNPPEGQLARGFAGQGDNFVIESIQIFDRGGAARYLESFRAGIAECGSYSDGTATVQAEPIDFPQLGDETIAYRLTGPPESPQDFAGTIALVRTGDVVTAVTAASIAGDPISDRAFVDLVETAVADVADVEDAEAAVSGGTRSAAR